MSVRLPRGLARASLLVAALAALAACADDNDVSATSPRPAGALASKGSKSNPTPSAPAAPALPVVRAVTLSPSSVAAGASAVGTVTLTAASPAGGTFVGISSNNTAAATVSGSVTIPAGDSVATFTVTSHPVAQPDFAAISATANQVTVTAVLDVTPSGTVASSVVVAPRIISVATSGTGTVTLSAAAPEGGAVVTLASGNAALAAVPASLTIPAGVTSGSFPVTGGRPASATSVSITASYGGVTAATSVIVDVPPPSGQQVTALTVSQNPVLGGTTIQGTVTIASAGATATTVSVTSTDATVATVPASVTVPAGSTTATFPIATSSFGGNTAHFSLITASANGTAAQVDLTTTPLPSGPPVASLTLFPSSIGGGGPLTGPVTLASVAPTGAAVHLTSSRPDLVQVPDVVFLGTTTATADFPITTSRTSASTPVTITATNTSGPIGNQVVATLTVTTAAPPPPDVVRVTDARWAQINFKGGTLSVRATSTSANAILTVFLPGVSSPIFVLTNKGGGTYEGSHNMESSKPTTVIVRSNLGGSGTLSVK